MKTIPAFVRFLAFFTSLTALAAPTIVYVSEAGEKRIVVYAIDESSGELTRKSAVDLPAAPGSLALSLDRRHLYASMRSMEVASITVDTTTGALSNPTLSSLGCNASYLHVDKTGRWLLAAAYFEGVVTVSSLANGIVGAKPVTTLETGKKAHSIQTDPANRFAFVPHVVELNKVEQLRFDAATGKLTSNSPSSMAGGAGQGPRHMQFHPNGRWAYFVNEQGQSVSRCDYDATTGTLTLRETVSTTPADWDKAKGSCADIHLSSDGRFAYASNRGHDSLAVFSIDPKSGQLKSLGQTPTEKTPRSFCLVPGEKFVVAAGQGSNRLIVYRRNASTGALTPLKTYDSGKSPAWVLGVKFP